METRMKPGDVVRHFKGNRYQILYFAKDSETQEDARCMANAAFGCARWGCSFRRLTRSNIRM